MQIINTQLPEIKIVGITARTDNARIFEQDPSTNDIAATVQKYFHGGLSSKIMHKANPGVTYCVYTEYESDLNGKYTYVIGEEVTSFDNLPEGFTAITLPAQKYAKFTNKAGTMPDVCIDMWKNIWQMDAEELGGKRGYLADFEIYDERAADHKNAVLDIYIGILE